MKNASTNILHFRFSLFNTKIFGEVESLVTILFFLIREHSFTIFSRLNSKGGVEDTRLDAKTKAKDTKKSEAKAKD